MSLLLIVLSCLQLVAVSYSQPFRVIISSRGGPRGNNFSLRCQATNNGTTITTAEFYWNGVMFGDNDCTAEEYASISSSGIATLNVTPSCEGNVQCGASNILSPPLEIQAYPELLNSSDNRPITMQLVEGEDVTLPCRLSVSSLQTLIINWFVNRNGENSRLPNNDIDMEDYSLTLKNVTVLQSGYHYYCRAVSRDLSDSFRTLRGPQVILSIRRRHESPNFMTNITYDTSSDGHIFRISARGTQPLVFKWFLNSQKLMSEQFVSHLTGQIVEVRSEITLRNLPVEMSQLYVNVSNGGRAFAVSRNGFLLPHNVTVTASVTVPSPSPAACNESGTNGPLSVTMVTSQYVPAILGVVVFISLLILTVMTVVICYKRCKHKKEEINCARCHTLIQRGSSDSSIESGQPMLEIQESQLAVLPDNQEPMKMCTNPLAAILIQVGTKYRNCPMTRTTLSASLQSVIVDVLENPNVTFNDEMTVYFIEKLRNHIAQFGDMQRRAEVPGAPLTFSRQISAWSNYGPRRSFEGNNQLIPSPLREESTRPGLARGISSVDPEMLNVLPAPTVAAVNPLPLAANSTSQANHARLTVRQTSSEEYCKAQENPVTVEDMDEDETDGGRSVKTAGQMKCPVTAGAAKANGLKNGIKNGKHLKY